MMNKISFIGLACAASLPVPAANSSESVDFMAPIVVHELKPYQDVRFKDLRSIDFSTRPELAATLWFNQKTLWPDSAAVRAAAQELLARARNPGLGIGKLHAEGITGAGVAVAIIDQPLFQDHEEFGGKIVTYHDMGCQSETSMHGPGVASLLVGNRCGTAPQAQLYYVAAPSWTRDTAYQAQALEWLVEQNAGLAPGHKIRVVSVSAAPSGNGSPFKKNLALWDAACERAERAGIMVLDCTEHHGFIGPCYYDAGAPEDVSRCKPGFPSMPWGRGTTRRLLVPCSGRTTAEEYLKGEFGYQYCGQAGLSWSIPYCAGVLALGWQVKPELSSAPMKELLFKSAHKCSDGALIINPQEFIRLVRLASAGS